MTARPKASPRWHRVFVGGMFMKAAFGILDCVGSVLLLGVTKSQIGALAFLLTERELAEDPDDLLANAFLRFSGHVGISTQHFGALYLLVHGVVNLFLVYNLLRGRLWAFPAALSVYAALMSYQVYRFSHTHSITLLGITIVDIAIMGFIWKEYRYQRSLVGKSDES